MHLTPSLAAYQQRITSLSAEINSKKKKRGIIAWLRFAAVLAIFASLYYLNPFGWTYAILAAGIFVAAFLRLIVLSGRNNDLISNLERLLLINQQEIQIASGSYTGRPAGSAYLPPLHDYVHDLDIFGSGSLYQFINRTTSEQGHQALAQWLLHPADSVQIKERQQSVIELTDQYEWRQQLQATGLANKITGTTQHRIENWIKEPFHFSEKYWQWIRFVFPALILTALALTIASLMPTPYFYAMAFIYFIIAGAISRKVSPVYSYLDKMVREIETLSKSISWIEQQHFKSALLTHLHAHYVSGTSRASKQVQELKEILDRLDLRLNPFLFIFLNTFLFWDLQQVLILEKWKARNSSNISAWFESLGTMEALSTVAGIAFNHPMWCFPALDEKHGTFKADNLGHPLIAEQKRVTSSFSTSGEAKLALVTGSNMAGKSTFLRSIGINIVLAMMGSPVCSSRCTVSSMRVISSMRISDNLQENTSTFYAELKKLKYIIEAVNNRENVFLLLDEILRGTNSLDRQIGSKALIRQLIRHRAVGLLATHDLELAALEQEYRGNIHNHHFDVQVENDELYFDYKLKEGVCKSLNASILMKKIGIEL